MITLVTNVQTISDIQVEGISAAVQKPGPRVPRFPELSIMTDRVAKQPMLRCVCLYSQDFGLKGQMLVMPAQLQ